MTEEQDLVAATLASMPPPDVKGDFVARVNARIDETAGWLGLTDFRVWTLRLAPAAAALALVAVFWSAPSAVTPTTASSVSAAPSATFSPASLSDWQSDVSSDAMLEAALSPRGGYRVR
jgi:hypothetical protein